MSENENRPIVTEIEQVRQALNKGKRKRLRKMLRETHPPKVASLLDSLDPAQRSAAWQQVDDKAEQAVLAHTSAELRRFFAQEAVEPEAETRTQLACLRDAIERGKLMRVSRMLGKAHPAKIAGQLESLPPLERIAALEMVECEQAGKVLIHLHKEVRAQRALAMDMQDLITAAHGLDLDDLVDLIHDLPKETGRELLRAMDRRERAQIESMLSYPEDSAGGLMNTDQISVRAGLHLRSVLRYLRLLEDLPDNTDKQMVVDRRGRYQGVLQLRRLLTTHPEQHVKEVMNGEFPAVAVDTPSHEVAMRFEELDLISAPVVDAEGRLVGRITSTTSWT